jgi:hypothetical protein
MTHDDERSGTTTLFAAVNVLDGTVVGRNWQRYCHGKFFRFLNPVEGCLAKLTRRRLKHAVVNSFVDRQQAINSRIETRKAKPRALRLESRSEGDHRRRQAEASTVGHRPLGGARRHGR